MALPGLRFPEAELSAVSRVIWSWPKAKAEADMLLAWLAAGLSADAELWLLGPNKSGIKSAPRFLEQRGWTVRKVGSARHCLLLRASPPAQPAPFDLNRYWARVEVPEAADRELWSLPGVFSHSRIDKGSRCLLPFLRDLPGPALDFGSGAGLLALTAAAHQPTLAMTGVDHDWLAVLSSRRTAEQSGMTLEVHWMDGLTALQGQWAALVTNPPFHTGLATDYEITRRMLADSRRLLQPGGLWLGVVNDHLPYQDWLNEHLQQVTCLHHGGGFRVWQGRV